MLHFQKHFARLKEHYQTPLVIVNLLDQTGRELCLSESYHQVGGARWLRFSPVPSRDLFKHVAKFDSQDPVFYHAFDFHRHYSAVGFTAVCLHLAGLFSHALPPDCPQLHVGQ
jgi:hypothetical protein